MDLEKRIQTLERQARPWKAFAGAALLALVVIFGAAAAPARKIEKEIYTRKIVITDSIGRPRIIFSVDDVGARIDLRDEKGNLRTIIASSKEGSGLAFRYRRINGNLQGNSLMFGIGGKGTMLWLQKD